jgi:hypothetical protein
MQFDVRFGSKADICTAKRHVRFTPNSDIDCVFRHVRFGPKADIAPPDGYPEDLLQPHQSFCGTRRGLAIAPITVD